MPKPTEDQKKIFYYIDKRTEHLFIKARAGCGKTSTIVASMKLIPKEKKIIFLAFNKHIQNELENKLPEHVKTKTIHALGYGAILNVYGKDKKIEVDEFKVDKLLKKFSKRWNLKDEFNNDFEIEGYLNSLKKVIDLCRLTLTLKKEYIPYISDKYNIIDLTDVDVKRISDVLDVLILDRETIDFTDMVFLPAIDNKIWFYQQDIIFVDEAQDISKAQQRIIEKIIKRDRKTKKILGRLIAVGDPMQKIYSFTGVSDKSIEFFENFDNNTAVLPLNTTFRCAKNIVKHANKIVPDLKALDDADDGIVRDGDVLAEAEDGDFVLCRTTAPLVTLFFELLKENKKTSIKGSDIGISLCDMLYKHKTVNQAIGYWTNEVIDFQKRLESTGILNVIEHSGFMNLFDRVETLKFLAKNIESNDINTLVNNIKEIFTEKITGIVLSTVHKVKGLEAKRVFIIRPDLLPMKCSKAWQALEEKNLHYVAITRAKKELIYDRVWKNEIN